MRATSVGHAGILIDTLDGSILCDPWFLPAFFGSWFVFPRKEPAPAKKNPPAKRTRKKNVKRR